MGIENWKSSWTSGACMLSRQELAYVNDSAISSEPQVRTPSTEGAQEQYSEWNTRPPPTLPILKQKQECQGKPHLSTKVTPWVFLCFLRFETYFKFTISAMWISPSLLELPNSVLAAKATIRYTHKLILPHDHLPLIHHRDQCNKDLRSTSFPIQSCLENYLKDPRQLCPPSVFDPHQGLTKLTLVPPSSSSLPIALYLENIWK